eukprot:5171729-Alexandrium_andersonii.AAC.1
MGGGRLHLSTGQAGRAQHRRSAASAPRASPHARAGGAAVRRGGGLAGRGPAAPGRCRPLGGSASGH